jgi:hypothetical protein
LLTIRCSPRQTAPPEGAFSAPTGWQWSKHVKPIAKTDSCQAPHMGYFISGRMKVVMDDGEEMEYVWVPKTRPGPVTGGFGRAARVV